MNKSKQKGVILVVTTIVMVCISLIVAGTFMVTSKYNSRIIKKENELRTSLNNNGDFGLEVFYSSEEDDKEAYLSDSLVENENNDGD